MRKIDEQKKIKITEAVITLVERDGLTNLTTAKVAKTAGVSPATLYIYYQDKTDMLSRIYELVKDELHVGLLERLAGDAGQTGQQLKTIMAFSVAQYRRYPRRAQFIQTLWTNPEVLDERARQHGTELTTALGQLFQEVSQSSDYAALSQPALELLLATPGQLLLRQPQVSDKELTTLYLGIIRAVQR
ncbi:TetR/AcrR family transcriptional regulator [Levilactobacillus fujinensis]|uniref:TetR/AcrR family transcriptional regulator n=1 Tax=Levilactobacillus fujinensis TaxID=2486024 RepID=A0ABW1TI88_9LACO|nr:TetR/AcrR family transcriptional regulator [Levilactobacillus fujinensis]